jgi:ParB-like chromosome segregation protein Spo0J
MKKINALSIRIDGGTQSRKELNQHKVLEYADLMRDGVIFPPITVFFDGSDYWLSAGFHRFFAHKEVGNVAIDCEVIEGTVRQAKWHSWGSNVHGLPHTNEEKRLIILEILKDPEYSKYSNIQIAKHVGVHSVSVGRYRAFLGEKPKEVVYVKDGQERTMKLRQDKKEEAKVEPKVEPAEEKILELTDTIVSLDEEVTKLRDIIATKKWDATDIEQQDAHETILELREKIKMLELENKSLRDSRDMYQHRNAELIRQVKSLQKKK